MIVKVVKKNYNIYLNEFYVTRLKLVLIQAEK